MGSEEEGITGEEEEWGGLGGRENCSQHAK